MVHTDLLNIPIEKYNLSNGLEVILFEKQQLPFVSVNIWYKVGSANEIRGKTGLAHLFEHMMFQGSKNVPKEMHFRYIQETGGTLNASTSFDRTNYFEKLPANELELALWLESDRMGFFIDALDQTKLDNQKSVVLNERLERYDNQPYGLAWEKMLENLYPENHPYNWPTIGHYKDIESYNLDDVKTFFQKYYAPSNATIVVGGNFEIKNVKSLLEKYFGGLKNDIRSEKKNSESVKLNETKFITFKDKVNLERIYLGWPTQNAFNEDDAALDIFSDILTGSKNARLTRKLIYDLQIVQDVNSMQFSGKYGGHFMIVATAKPGKSLDEIKKIVLDEISLLANQGISKQELLRSKNVIRSNFIYSLQNIDTITDLLNLYNFYLDKPNSFNYDLSRYDNCDESKIQEIAANYFSKSFVDLRIIPDKQNADR